MQALTTWYRNYFPVAAQPINEKKENLFFNIPVELVLSILSHLNAYDLVQLGRTCKTFHHLTNDRALDIARLNLFKKTRTARLCPAPGSLSCFLHDNQVIYSNGEPNNSSYEIRNLEKNATRKIVEKGGLEKGELKDFYYFVYRDIEDLKIKFVSKEDPSLGTELPLGNFHINGLNIRSHTNSVVFQIDDYLICIKNAEQFFVIPPIDFEDDTFGRIIDFDLNEKNLIISRKIYRRKSLLSKNHSYFLQQCYDLDSERVISQKMTDKIIDQVLITNRYIITLCKLKWPFAYADIDIYDLKFNFKSRIWLVCHTPHFDWEDRFNAPEYYYCYEDRLVAFLNMRTLLFFDLNTGQQIKKHELGPSTDVEIDPYEIIRISSHRDKVVASMKKSIRLFDLHTGNQLQRFVTSVHPVWVNLGEDYNLRYSAYDKKKGDYFFAHLRTPIKKIAKPKKRRKRT